MPVPRRPDNLTQPVRIGRSARRVMGMLGSGCRELSNCRVDHLMGCFYRARPVQAGGVPEYRHQIEALATHHIFGNRVDIVRPRNDIGSVLTQPAPCFHLRRMHVRVQGFGTIDQIKKEQGAEGIPAQRQILSQGERRIGFSHAYLRRLRAQMLDQVPRQPLPPRPAAPTLGLGPQVIDQNSQHRVLEPVAFT
ncbi:hypothetical protein PFLmoz3_04172 [Pseudomonas fluorescens]|uniref:Uncharacterized protein n=1 Tax=Pseudomonas fluorescens TaxID=294 RepID=A0A109LES3_PSEFL|nr:hypothetical protein PFLmoz3_04172 [Pseudomonas fluorescens]